MMSLIQELESSVSGDRQAILVTREPTFATKAHSISKNWVLSSQPSEEVSDAELFDIVALIEEEQIASQLSQFSAVDSAYLSMLLPAQKQSSVLRALKRDIFACSQDPMQLEEPIILIEQELVTLASALCCTDPDSDTCEVPQRFDR